MQVENDELDGWALVVDGIRCQTLNLTVLVMGGRRLQAREVAQGMHLEAARLLAGMELAGATLPPYLPPMRDVPLELLTSPANRRLYRALREALDAVRDVGRERGHEVPYCGVIADTLNRVEREVYGPQGWGEDQ
jgi:hypothetical protein